MPPPLEARVGENWKEVRSSEESEFIENMDFVVFREFFIERLVADPEGITDDTPDDIYLSTTPPLPRFGDKHALFFRYPTLTVRGVQNTWWAPPSHQFVRCRVEYATGLANFVEDGATKRKVLWSTSVEMQATTEFFDAAGFPIEGGSGVTVLRPVVTYTATMPSHANVTKIMRQTPGSLNDATFDEYKKRDVMFVGATAEHLRGVSVFEELSSTVALKFIAKRPPLGFEAAGEANFGGWDSFFLIRGEDGLPEDPPKWDAQKINYRQLSFISLFSSEWDHTGIKIGSRSGAGTGGGPR